MCNYASYLVYVAEHVDICRGIKNAKNGRNQGFLESFSYPGPRPGLGGGNLNSIHRFISSVCLASTQNSMLIHVLDS